MLSPCLWGELDFVASDFRSGKWQLVSAARLGYGDREFRRPRRHKDPNVTNVE